MNTITEEERNAGLNHVGRGPVLMECLGGGRRIVRVGDVVTPKDREGTWEYATVKGFTADGQRADVSLPDGETREIDLSLWLLTSHSELEARAQLESVKEMVAALEGATASQNEDLIDEARSAIQSDALSVEVRSGWMTVEDFRVEEPARGDYSVIEGPKAAEFKILLCTGGPAVQIVGTLSEHGEPETAKLQHQDWGTPWTDYRLTDEDQAALIAYASEFCFA